MLETLNEHEQNGCFISSGKTFGFLEYIQEKQGELIKCLLAKKMMRAEHGSSMKAAMLNMQCLCSSVGKFFALTSCMDMEQKIAWQRR